MMMKPVNNDPDEENSNSNNNNPSNWLGFSLLSPPHHHLDDDDDDEDSNNKKHHMKISSSSSSSSSAAAASTPTSDVPQQRSSQTQLTSVLTLPTSVDLHSLPPNLSYGSHCYGVFGGENDVAGSYPSPLSVMPLKSDGSLCLMEALRCSQAQGTHLKSFSVFQ